MTDFPIRDQRTMQGADVHGDVVAVEAYWDWWAAAKGFENSPLPDGRPGVAIVDDDRTVTPFVDANRWVADCPNCHGGIAVWTENPRAVCLDCGHRYAVEFPPAELLDAAISTLEFRPVDNRHWDPQTEAIAQLVAENLGRGDEIPKLTAAVLETAPLAVTDAAAAVDPVKKG